MRSKLTPPARHRSRGTASLHPDGSCTPESPSAKSVAEEAASPGSCKGDYAVGYGKPPRHSRFRKGKSGNPTGRPKGARNIRTEIRKMLGERVDILVNGKPRRIPTRAAAAQKLREKALKGDLRALQSLIQLDDEPLAEIKGAGSQQESAAFGNEAEQDFADFIAELRDQVARELKGEGEQSGDAPVKAKRQKRRRV